MDKETAISQLKAAKAAREAAADWSANAQLQLQSACQEAHSAADMTHIEIGVVLGVHRNTVMNWCKK